MSTLNIEIEESKIDHSTITKNWWTFIVRGIFALIFAILAFALPVSAILALTIVFGAYALIDGIFGIISGVRKIKKGERWGWLLFSGILSIIAGLVVIISPLIASIVIASFLWASISLWSIFVGVTEIITAIRLRKKIKREIWMILSGLFSTVFGGIILWMFFTQPQDVLLASGWLLGISALFSAGTYFMLGYNLKRAQK